MKSSRDPRVRQFSQRRMESWEDERRAAKRPWWRGTVSRRWTRLGPHTCPACGAKFSTPQVTLDSRRAIVSCPYCCCEMGSVKRKGWIARWLERLGWGGGAHSAERE